MADVDRMVIFDLNPTETQNKCHRWSPESETWFPEWVTWFSEWGSRFPEYGNQSQRGEGGRVSKRKEDNFLSSLAFR